MMPGMDQPPPQSRLFPVIVLGALVLLGLLAWQLFPVVQGWIANQDCVALRPHQLRLRHCLAGGYASASVVRQNTKRSGNAMLLTRRNALGLLAAPALMRVTGACAADARC